MKSTAIVSAIAAAALGFSSLSFAQGHGQGDRGDRGDRNESHQARQGGQRQQSQPHQQQYQPQYQQQRQYQQPQYSQHGQYSQYNQYRQQGQYGQQGQWAARAPQYRHGDALPYQFRQRQYYVNDWRSHRGLYAPPYGYQWVQSDGGDYLLVALATGLIANLLLNQY
ncbi:MAG: hypothetical protein JWQ07_3806 [Ramlibacter sp.]|nr:hypothetical protein [Ramlibacter sp.]